MNFLKSYTGVLLFITLVFSQTIFASESIDKLLEVKDYQSIKKLINSTKIVDNEMQIPENPQDWDLIILDNEYEVKQLFQFYNGEWHEKVTKELAQLLGNEQGTTYGNLFNYKVNTKEFNPYESDSFKNIEVATSVVVKIINSSNSEVQINENLTSFLQKEVIDPNSIINIQIMNINKPNCKIVITYKN